MKPGDSGEACVGGTLLPAGLDACFLRDVFLFPITISETHRKKTIAKSARLLRPWHYPIALHNHNTEWQYTVALPTVALQ